jgi:ribonucleoside-triphosphate reductase (thioredoxin)
LLADGTETTSLKVGDVVKASPVFTKPAEADYKLGFAHGLIFADGTRNTYYPQRHFIRLCGEKAKYLPDLESIEGYVSTTSVGGDPAVTIVRKGENWKAVPTEDKSLSYQHGFFAGWQSLDGWTSPSNTLKLDTQSAVASDWLIQRAALFGVLVSGHTVDTRATSYGERSAPLHRLTLTSSPVEFVVESIADEGKVEEVFCVSEHVTRSFTLAGGLPTGNCAFVTTANIDTDFAQPFSFLMDMSMLGVGVGGDCEGKGKIRLHTPRLTDDPFVVEDSREGWVELIREVLNSFVGKNAYPRVIDYSQVRPRGAAIKGFGGIASGAGPLKQLVAHLTDLLLPKGVVAVVEDGTFQGPNGRTLQWADGEGRIGKAQTEFVGEGESYKVTSTIIVDIFNFIGKCVVAGGVRRTAEIMFGDADDKEFMLLKQDKEALMDRRWASNNSIFAKIGMDYTEVAASLSTNGEPGTAWLENMQRFSRMGHPADNKDHRARGSNPCVEQTLEDHELCCLVETYPAHHDSFEDYQRTLKMAYLYAKTVTLVPTHNPKTNAVMGRNRRIGASQSGIIQAMNKLGRREFLGWCDNGYDYIQNLDKLYADWLCVPRSIKTTSVKPSGTVSLLCGATPGIHYPHSEYYIRNIRIQNTSPLLALLRDSGHPVEADAYSHDTSVVSFPIHEPHFAKSKDDVTIWEQFANAADLQHHWADNQVSITVTFRKDEAKDIKTCLETYETKLKAISLLPLADSDHSYVQAPYIKATKEQYEMMASKITPFLASSAQHETTDQFCDGETCTIAI